MTAYFDTRQGLPPLRDGRHNHGAVTGDDLGPMRNTVVDLARQASDAAGVRIEAFEQRLATRADALTRAAFYTATADLLTQALHVAVDACFERVDGVLVGMEPSGRVNVQLPWSKRSHGLYALRRAQADMLRVIATAWQLEYAAGRFRTAPVFVRDDIEHRWYFNLDGYRTAEAAHAAMGWITPGYVRNVELAMRQLRSK